MNMVKIYPSRDELQTVTTCVLCTETGCSAIFSSESNLNLHLVKTHKKEWNIPCGNNKEYHCPSETCVYNSTKSFKSLKLLKQHYLKVHSDKSFVCQQCSKGFPTSASQNRHEKYCGISFKCCECETSYPCYESLLTHARRKKHKILEKSFYNPNLEFVAKSNSGSDIKMFKKGSFILPKVSTSLQLLNLFPSVAKSDSSIEKSSQTEARKDSPQLKTKETQVSKEGVYQISSSKHSQTSDLLKMLSSTETQTIGDYINKKSKLPLEEDFTYGPTKSEEDILLKSIKTQTVLVTSQTKSCNTTFTMDESEYDPFIQRSSSGTQTVISTLPSEVPYSSSTSTHDSIHTDTSDLHFYFTHPNCHSDFNDDMTNFDSSTFLNTDMETQTDLMFDNILNDSNFANIETQTIDIATDVGEDTLTSYNVSDILSNTAYTQTFYDYLSCSVESQTMMSHNKLQGGMFYKDMANIETQTEIDLKLLLDSINA